MPDLSLDLRFLRYALLVAEQGSFRRAALKLDLPQSTVSRRIKILEDRIGIAIFTRDYAGIQLTEAGRLFLEEAAIGARHLSNAVNAMNSIRRGNGGRLRVSIFAALSTGFVKSLFQQYLQRHHQVDIRIEEGTAQTSLAGILEGRLDLAFVTGEPSIPRCQSLKLWDERLFVVLRHNHPLVSVPEMSWPSLCSERFIVTTGGRGPEIEDYLVARLSGPGFRPDIQTHAVSRETLINMVGLGFGIALVTESAVRANYEEVVFRPLPASDGFVPASAVWLSANTNPAMRPFLKLARALATQQSGKRGAPHLAEPT
jgi:DNA-binding transcriptional LysR family regulator